MSSLMVGEPDWARLSKEWERSRLCQKKFCEQHGVSYYVFRTRRAELKKGERGASMVYENRAKEGGFLPVTVEVEGSMYPSSRPSTDKVHKEPGPGAGSGELEVELPFGVVLRFRGVHPR